MTRNKDREKDRDRDKEKEKEKEREREKEKEKEREREREREREKERERERDKERDREKDKLGIFTLGGEKKKLDNSPANSPLPVKSEFSPNLSISIGAAVNVNAALNPNLSPDANNLSNNHRLNYGKQNTLSSSIPAATKRSSTGGPALSMSSDTSIKGSSSSSSISRNSYTTTSVRGSSDHAETQDVTKLKLKLSESIQEKEESDRQRMVELEQMKQKISNNMESSAQYNFENNSSNSRSGLQYTCVVIVAKLNYWRSLVLGQVSVWI